MKPGGFMRIDDNLKDAIDSGELRAGEFRLTNEGDIKKIGPLDKVIQKLPKVLRDKFKTNPEEVMRRALADDVAPEKKARVLQNVKLLRGINMLPSTLTKIEQSLRVQEARKFIDL